MAAGNLTMDAVERAYATLVFAQAGGYREAARRLAVDWRTLKSKLDPPLLENLRARRS